ncbi:MFS transporter [Sphaerisporangium krabiense]|uniref:EmrB/QacA subfamily drug resistance transporter n=1 Tax=Sphaerisporangium krabiense TaxID=763782 RepID=A0A7W8Z7Z2_9ACTN|nr:MFS transporter [Sphaerisporangium krabiense]MBB5629072.1 EmrB/QacA subfamily drug resistance transporter [Sphaerisporangium krabiense]GII60089.1 MFS transporter [Sphaerisporangium krabiense]
MLTSTTLRDHADTKAARPGVALAVVAGTQLMIALDATVVTIALPRIQADLGFSATALSWVQNAYMLAFGGLLLLGGRAGDILGRRRAFLGGVVLFTLASLLAGLATAPWWLLAARALQGVGAAVAGPSVLALIATTFTETRARARALSIYSAVAGAGAAVGLIGGGLLTGTTSWRWVFFVNLPIGALVLLLAPRFIPETDRRPGRFDLAGALTCTTGMTALVYGFISVAEHGWGDPVSLGAFALAAVALGGFVAVERRARQPIMPLRLFRARDRAAAYLAQLVLAAAMFGVFFFLTQFFQAVLRLEPLAAGLAFLPMAGTQFALVRVVPSLIPRLGAKTLMVTGAALAAVAMVLLTRLSADTAYFPGIFVPLLLLGMGGALAFLPLNMTILSGVAPADSGAASGLAQTMVWAGGSLGSAVLVTILASSFRHAAAAPREVLAAGIAHSFAGGTAFAVCGLLVTLLLSRRPRATDG